MFFRLTHTFLIGALTIFGASEGMLHADSVVVFNEIMYHPPTNEPALEWVELHNQMAVDVDMSGWSIGGGIRFTFAEGTIVSGGGYLVVALSPPDLRAATGLTNVLGPFNGRLSNGGDTLQLFNNNQRLMDAISYGVDGDWPAGPDGSGVSLAKRAEDSASAPAKNWTVSPFVGGTPGRRNFAAAPFEVTQATPVLIGGAWRYDVSGANSESAWKQPGFDDSAWPSGKGLFQAGKVIAPFGDLQPLPSVFSSGLDPKGNVLPPGSAEPHYQLTQSAQGTPPPPPIPATVIQNHPAWLANDAASSWIGPVNPGTVNVAAGIYNYRTTFTLDGFDPTTAALKMNFGADNRVTDVRLNGVSLGIIYVGFSSLSGDFNVTKGFLPGTNVLDFLTVNDTSTPNPAGFRARLTGSARRQFPIQTVLPQGATSYFFRTTFALTGAPEQSRLELDSVIADGAVFYLNGAEVLRLNMPAGPVSGSTLASSNVANPAYSGPFALSAARLIQGTNVLAVEVHQGPGGANDILFGADLFVTTTNILVPPAITLGLNEVSSATNSDFWIELINFGRGDLDSGGCVLALRGTTTDAEYVFPLHVLPAGGLLHVSKGTLGFRAEPGDRLFLYASGRARVLDAVVAKAEPRARRPDGTGQWWFPTAATPGASNYFVLREEIVINEIMYDAPSLPAGQSQTLPESWLELYNRSSKAVDLTGWRLSGDIDYSFLPATTIAAGGYLIVAKDTAAMQIKYPGVAIVGPFNNNLRHSGARVLLLDPAGNPADELQYFHGKPWPDYAAGGGSSLELRDPWADNSRAEAWAASIESGRSSWSNYTYRAIARNVLGPTVWKEFVMGLLDAGECLIDDVSVIESPSGTPVQMLQNGSFETGLTAWRALGTHSYSRVELDPEDPANHVLHVITTGWTFHLHDHLETTLANGRAVTDGREYQISFRAKWLAGNNHLNTRLYFNRVAKTIQLPMPSSHGTPGARNSTYATNIGPTFCALSHSPVAPKPNERVTVSVCASDPQGVRDVKAWWSANGSAWNSTPMLPTQSSSEIGYTNYVASLPGLPAGALVQFFVEAVDELGARSTYPAGGTNSRALFKVDDGKPLMPRLHRLRLLMTAADTQQLHAPTNVMSDDRKGLTVVYDEREVFYDAGVHLQSSERGRNDSSRVGFSLKFHPDQLFRGVQDTVALDRSGGYSGLGGRQDEILLWHAVNHAGGMFGLECDLAQVFAPRSQEDSTAMMRMSAFGGDYWDAQFKNGGDGNLYRLELIYYPTTTATGNPQAPKLPQPDDVINVEIKNWGDDPENYRWIFVQENHADVDDYSQLIGLNKAFSLTGAALEAQTSQLMDTDEWMRALAFKAFTGEGDTFTYGLNHNWKIYFRPEDGKALGLLWDMDFAFVQTTRYAFPGTGSANTYKLTTLPNNYRRFYNHLLDILTTTVNASHLDPWAAHYAGLLGQDWRGVVNYLQQRASYIRSTMPLSTPFAITSNGGRDFSATNDHVLLTGTAPLTVKEIEFNSVRYPIRWTSLTNWSLTVPLPDRVNGFDAQGIDNYGKPLANAIDSITITNLGNLATRAVVINEWMADNAGPRGFADPLDGRFSDWFELYNPNPVSINLSGYFLTDTLGQPQKWTVPTNTMVAPHDFLLVWADGQTNLNGLGTHGDLHANFKLAKSGSDIGLYGPDGSPQHVVTFGPQLLNISQGLFPDGSTNGTFFMTNWTPRSANQLGEPPMPQISSINFQPDGTITFEVLVIPGRTYRVEYKDTLNATTWTMLGGSRVATGTPLTITDIWAGQRERYYRVILLQ